MKSDFAIRPVVIRPFDEKTFRDVADHVRHVRRCFDWPGVPYHPSRGGRTFNRWGWHNLPLLKSLHNAVALRRVASEVFGREVKPSYSFLSMYGPDGVCPAHIDRPQCQFTIDLLIQGGEDWPLYIDDRPYVLKPGEAVCYSGTRQEHYRKPMQEDSRARSADLAFFHWVVRDWMGALD